MIHVDSVTAAVTALLEADPVLVSSGFTVREGEALNAGLGQTPWVGVYPGQLTVAPHTLGGTQPWQAHLELLLYVQEGSFNSATDATRRLGRAQAAVLEALRKHPSLGGTVLLWSELSATPYKRDVLSDSWLFTNELLLRTHVRG
jgi:hypothetical protein